MRMLRFGPILFMLIALSAVGQLSNTIFVPAMSVIARDMSVKISLVQLLMSTYLIAYGFVAVCLWPTL